MRCTLKSVPVCKCATQTQAQIVRRGQKRPGSTSMTSILSSQSVHVGSVCNMPSKQTPETTDWCFLPGLGRKTNTSPQDCCTRGAQKNISILSVYHIHSYWQFRVTKCVWTVGENWSRLSTFQNVTPCQKTNKQEKQLSYLCILLSSSRSTKLTVDMGSLQSVCATSANNGHPGPTSNKKNCPPCGHMSDASYYMSVDEEQGSTLTAEEATQYLELSPKPERCR